MNTDYDDFGEDDLIGSPKFPENNEIWNNEDVLGALKDRMIRRKYVSEADGEIIQELELTDFEIPKGVKTIQRWALAGCFDLINVSIPDSVTYIGESAFTDCKSLTSLTIPESVKDIGVHAFDYCSNLKELIFKGKTLEKIKRMDYYPWGIDNPEEVIVADDSPRPSLGESLMMNWAKRYIQSMT